MNSTLKNLIVAIGLLVLFTYTANAQWIRTNIPEGEHIYSLATSSTTAFAGSYGSGVFRSGNNGTSWIAVDSGLNFYSMNIQSLGVSGSSIFAGTYSSGVLRST